MKIFFISVLIALLVLNALVMYSCVKINNKRK